MAGSYFPLSPTVAASWFGINTQTVPKQGDPWLTVGGKTCIGAENNTNTYHSNAPTLYIVGKIGVGDINPFASNADPDLFPSQHPTLHVRGDATITEKLTIQSHLYVTGGDLNVTGGADVGGNLDVVGRADVGGDLGVLGNTDITKKLTVTGPAEFNGLIDAKKKLTTYEGIEVRRQMTVIDEFGHATNPLVKMEKHYGNIPDERPLLEVRNGFIGQIEQGFFEKNYNGISPIDAGEKYIIIGSSTHAALDNDRNETPLFWRPHRRRRRRRPSRKETRREFAKRIENMIGAIEARKPDGLNVDLGPSARYGVTMQWNSGFAKLHLRKMDDIDHRTDTVFCWGSMPHDRLRFRFAGSRTYKEFGTTRGYDVVVLYPNGLMKVRGAILSCAYRYLSDERFKHEIEPIPDAIAKVMSIRGVSYCWRREEFPEDDFVAGRQMGLVAQNVESVCPELVSTDERGYKSVDYARMVSLLLEAIREQQHLIVKQDDRLRSLEQARFGAR